MASSQAERDQWISTLAQCIAGVTQVDTSRSLRKTRGFSTAQSPPLSRSVNNNNGGSNGSNGNNKPPVIGTGNNNNYGYGDCSPSPPNSRHEQSVDGATTTSPPSTHSVRHSRRAVIIRSPPTSPPIDRAFDSLTIDPQRSQPQISQISNHNNNNNYEREEEEEEENDDDSMMELQRRLIVVLPGEQQSGGSENHRLVKLNKSALRVYELDETEEDRSRPIDRFFFPLDLKHARASSLVLQLDHKGLTAVHERNQNAQGRYEPGLKHLLIVRDTSLIQWRY